MTLEWWGLFQRCSERKKKKKFWFGLDFVLRQKVWSSDCRAHPKIPVCAPNWESWKAFSNIPRNRVLSGCFVLVTWQIATSQWMNECRQSWKSARKYNAHPRTWESCSRWEEWRSAWCLHVACCLSAKRVIIFRQNQLLAVGTFFAVVTFEKPENKKPQMNKGKRIFETDEWEGRPQFRLHFLFFFFKKKKKPYLLSTCCSYQRNKNTISAVKWVATVWIPSRIRWRRKDLYFPSIMIQLMNEWPECLFFRNGCAFGQTPVDRVWYSALRPEHVSRFRNWAVSTGQKGGTKGATVRWTCGPTRSICPQKSYTSSQSPPFSLTHIKHIYQATYLIIAIGMEQFCHKKLFHFQEGMHLLIFWQK